MNNYRNILLILIFLSGCTILNKKSYDAYNVEALCLTKNDLNRNYIGMTKKQIIYILGEPIISDSFNDVYHYYFYNQDSKNFTQKQLLNLYFKDEKVFNIEVQ
ncbi:outer membrane protein assembly factor BamE [Buchnera aphidicola (Hyadaphis tataricae)]|uniref:Outer membrane protein assembly factor BamE n=1 Tax=Buchnera aphidicola (Hyadaphis tataricae) TaxID=1241859 RepID=A0A4D6Y648_9GAMM|nr:outer membrane protein assembly factor BamE [Buchnera aphidicola]QCI21501.1 outer membrane protein assembly factor BamE [Buchnera aphidicola (Hyadaphis tataricae)]